MYLAIKYFDNFSPIRCIYFHNDRQSMMTSSNGNIFRVTGALCGEFTGHRWIPRTKASDAELWCFLRSWGWWFKTPSRSLWRHCNVFTIPWHSNVQIPVAFHVPRRRSFSGKVHYHHRLQVLGSWNSSPGIHPGSTWYIRMYSMGAS